MSYDTKPDDSQNPAIGEAAFKGKGGGYYPCGDSEKRDVITTFVAPQFAEEKNWSCEYN